MTPRNENDAVALLHERFRREQREFENHWLWRELGTTPGEFFAGLDACLERNGLDRREWRRRLSQAGEKLERDAARDKKAARIPPGIRI